MSQDHSHIILDLLDRPRRFFIWELKDVLIVGTVFFLCKFIIKTPLWISFTLPLGVGYIIQSLRKKFGDFSYLSLTYWYFNTPRLKIDSWKRHLGG